MIRFCLPILVASAALAQAIPGTNTEVPEIDQPISRVTVSNVVAPVLVTDREGRIVDGLQPAQFHLWDNNKEQNIQVDVAFEPISMVIAIEASSRMDAILRQVRHLGSLMPLLMGSQGEAAVVAFDHRIRLMQDFTNDPDKIKVAIDRINAGSSSSRMIDTVDRAVYMLRKRPANNRRIILLVSETRDQASEGKVRESLQDAQLSNVLIYAVNVEQLAVRLTEKPQPPRPDPLPPTAYNLPMGVAPTPTSIANAYGVQNQAQFAPLIKEIFTDVKRIFVDNPTEVFAKGTGGQEFSFLKERGLEDAVQRMSQEIHSQYLISYHPNDSDEGGFHDIAVRADCSGCIATTRPGYYLGGGKIQ